MQDHLFVLQHMFKYRRIDNMVWHKWLEPSCSFVNLSAMSWAEQHNEGWFDDIFEVYEYLRLYRPVLSAAEMDGSGDLVCKSTTQTNLSNIAQTG